MESIDITDILKGIINQSETFYKIDHQIGDDIQLSGTIGFYLHTDIDHGDYNNQPEIKTQYVMNIIEDLSMITEDGEELSFHYDLNKLCEVFEI